MLCYNSTLSDLLLSQVVLLTDIRTMLSYWTAAALGAYEMSLLTVEVKVFITRRRWPHSPSSGRGITSLWDSRDVLRRHLFEVRIYCNWSHLPHSHKSLRSRFLKHVRGISILTAFPASSRHGLRVQMQRQSVVNFTFAIVKGTPRHKNLRQLTHIG